MSREHDVVTLSGVEYDALLSEAEDAARLREELAALRAAPAAERSWEKYALAEAGKFLRLAAAPGGPRCPPMER